ncbi:hypothetical protein NQZ79_g4017 [Umbelopsis isabellina]|nr:hypothetical protein NQZ79_g4017 [Umbelopsis isabellina]
MSNLVVKVYPGPQEFLDALLPQLEEHELENCQLIAKSRMWARDKVTGGYYAAVLEGEELKYALCWAPGNLLWLSYSLPDGSDKDYQVLLAKHLAQVEHAVKEVYSFQGCEPGGVTFKNAYNEAANQNFETGRAMSTYKLTAVKYPEQSRDLLEKGTLRLATKDDNVKLFAEWYRGYCGLCALSTPSTEDCEKAMTNLISVEMLYIWILEGRPVSMTFKMRPLKHGTSVAGVYTPPDLRRRGYATAMMAAFCAKLLETFEFVTLHADKYNPTSNHIYQDVGFVKVRDTNDYKRHD